MWRKHTGKSGSGLGSIYNIAGHPSAAKPLDIVPQRQNIFPLNVLSLQF